MQFSNIIYIRRDDFAYVDTSSNQKSNSKNDQNRQNCRRFFKKNLLKRSCEILCTVAGMTLLTSNLEDGNLLT